MSGVRLKDKVLSLGEHTLAFDQALSAIQVNSELANYEQSFIRFGNRIELEVLKKKPENSNMKAETLLLLKVNFDNENNITTMAAYSDEDEVQLTNDYPKVIEALIKVSEYII